MENRNNSVPKTRIYKVLIRMMNKLLTIDVPADWRMSKIRKFLEFNFNDQIKNSTISFVYSGKTILNDDTLYEIVKDKKDDELHQFIVLIKQKTENEIKESIKKSMASSFEPNISKEDLMNKKEFLKLENWIFDAYKDSLSQDLNKDLENTKEIGNIFPLFHPNVMSRVEMIQNSNISNITNIQPLNIENFPLRGYLKFGLLLKLCFLFILFAGNMKGYNFPLFVSFLIIYYWYNVKFDIEQFYQKKIEELNIKQNELEKLEISIDNESEEEEKEEIKENYEKLQENPNIVKSNEKKVIQENEKVFKRDDQLNEKEIKRIENERIIEEKVQRKSSGLSNKSDLDNKRGTSRRDTKANRKEKDLLNQNINLKDEGIFKRLSMLIIEIVVTFFLSLYPNWCDDFEQRNPIIDRKKVQKIPKKEKPKVEEENDILIENMEVQPTNQREIFNSSVDLDGKDKNERTIIKSNTDTRKVNNDDDQTKYHFVEEIENKTENEFVFSENVQIDNLSYFNEPVSEYKKKETENKVLNNK